MSEEAPGEEPTSEGLSLSSADGFEPLDWGLLPRDVCGHQLLTLLRDDFRLLDVRCEFALCVLCGAAMVRWTPSE